ncbi:MAG: copper resistance protein CopC [Rothia sp. (in: high G+C Gram-positive bacteria)]|uniref:copper resistance CopC family protein n=1 Tax=Rothia sp. (in: high G+C Gram-positive bacteria) TaxID=1885016 RepID=UPI0026E0C49F|nr:copper resistance CopC family protein [Rothia sp. (in: high G+C Gram-positive bacteria)]MDO5750199.1 copper resistance protein CopC [Rothia sp. (in: high G+C Gram-positive bacteria)]
MTLSFHSARRVLAALLTALMLTLGMGGAITMAYAHDAMVSSNPAKDATVKSLPAEIRLDFSGDLTVIEGGNRVSVTDPNGKEITEGSATIKGSQMTQKLKTEGAVAGTYTVSWRILSSDTHPVEGAYEFKLEAQGSATTEAAAASASASSNTQAASSDEGGVNLWLVALLGVGGAAAITLFAVITKGGRERQEQLRARSRR